MWPEEKICLATLDFYIISIKLKYGNKRCSTALAALAQETRLAVFRLLVETGPEACRWVRLESAWALPRDVVVSPQGTGACRPGDDAARGTLSSIVRPTSPP